MFANSFLYHETGEEKIKVKKNARLQIRFVGVFVLLHN